MKQIIFIISITMLFSCQTTSDKQSRQLSPVEMKAHMKKEAKRTEPDYICYIPGSYDYSTHDSHNEHFLVFNGPDERLMAIWTQSIGSTVEEGNRNRIVFSSSDDGGKSWLEPVHLVGPRTIDDKTRIASWAFPLVSKSGRIYVLYNRNQGISGWISFHTGLMEGIYSDDNGKTWSEPQQIPIPKSPYDDPEGKIPPEWIVWQKPINDLSGGYFVGYSHWLNTKVAYLKEVQEWPQIESVVEFMRFTNINNNPEPKDIQIRFSGWGAEALRVPHRDYPHLSVVQEPSLVRLPDKRLFCVMRTCSGYIWWSQSFDDGATWSNPQPLLYKDFGKPLMNPVAPDPIYKLSDGRYVIFYHNNRGGKIAGGLNDAEPREPLYISVGEFKPNGNQPIWFSQPKLFATTDNVSIDGVKHPDDEPKNVSLSMYSSFTNQNGSDVFWYPDRKCFLLGKKITNDLLMDLKIPE